MSQMFKRNLMFKPSISIRTLSLLTIIFTGLISCSISFGVIYYQQKEKLLSSSMTEMETSVNNLALFVKQTERSASRELTLLTTHFRANASLDTPRPTAQLLQNTLLDNSQINGAYLVQDNQLTQLYKLESGSSSSTSREARWLLIESEYHLDRANRLNNGTLTWLDNRFKALRHQPLEENEGSGLSFIRSHRVRLLYTRTPHINLVTTHERYVDPILSLPVQALTLRSTTANQELFVGLAISLDTQLIKTLFSRTQLAKYPNIELLFGNAKQDILVIKKNTFNAQGQGNEAGQGLQAVQGQQDACGSLACQGDVLNTYSLMELSAHGIKFAYVNDKVFTTLSKMFQGSLFYNQILEKSQYITAWIESLPFRLSASEITSTQYGEGLEPVYSFPIQYFSDLSLRNEQLTISVAQEDIDQLIRSRMPLVYTLLATSMPILLLIYLITHYLVSRPLNSITLNLENIERGQFDDVVETQSLIKDINRTSHTLVTVAHSLSQGQKQQDAFIDTLVTVLSNTLDEKSPYNNSHCARVSKIANQLADYATQSTSPYLRDFGLNTAAEKREFNIAALLHDCGKITTPEHVINKATKLESIHNRIHEIRTRFEVLWRDAEIEALQAHLAGSDNVANIQRELQQTQQRLQKEFEFVASCNVGSEWLDDAALEQLEGIGKQTWHRYFDDSIGLSSFELDQYHKNTVPDNQANIETLLSDKPSHIKPRDLALNQDILKKHNIKMVAPSHESNLGELYNLSIRAGTLNSEERFIINEHAISTITMLETIPFPDNLKRVPRYASTHHENLLGTGYPRQLSSEQLSIPERIIAIADIFEALTASDRPYKKSKTLAEAINIMSTLGEKGVLDQQLLNEFIKAKVFEQGACKNDDQVLS